MIRRMRHGGNRRCLIVCMAALCLLTGCAREAETVMVPRVVRVGPPAALLAPTPEPVWTGNLNGDLEDYGREAVLQLRQCNQDKARLRDWAAGEAAGGTE